MKGLLVALGLLTSLVQTGETEGAVASDKGSTTAPALGSALQMAAPVTLHFEVDTSAGPVTGTLAVSRVIARGLGGAGQFELVCEVDPLSLRTGDELRDRLLRRQLFGARPEALRFAAYTRAGANASATGQESAPMATAMGFWQTPHGRTRLDVPYGWEPAGSGGTLRLVLASNWSDLGLPEPEHPFVRVTGPVRMTLQVTLSK